MKVNESRTTARQTAARPARKLPPIGASEGEQLLRALRRGEIDAFIRRSAAGEQVFTLAGAEHPYRVMVETMSEGAMTLGPDGVILYCNRRLAEMVRADLAHVIGAGVADFFAPGEARKILSMIRRAPVQSLRERVELRRLDGTVLPAQMAIRRLQHEGAATIVAVVTELTEVVAAETRAATLNAELQEKLATLRKSLKDRDRIQAELSLTARTLEMANASSEIVIHATDETKLLKDICEAAVKVGGYMLAWVGYAEDDADKSVRPVALGGPHADYVANANVSWSGTTRRGRGPTGTAIRTGRAVVSRDFTQDSNLAPWRALAARAGFRSSAAIPLAIDGRSVGALTIYSDRPRAFHGRELKLLRDLAGNLAYGIGAIRTRTERDAAETEIRQSELQYRTLVEAITEGVIAIDETATVKFVNPQLARMLGYTVAELIGHKSPTLVDEDAQRVVGQRLARRARGEAERYELVWPRKGGGHVPTLVSAQPVFDAEHRFRGSISVVTDLSELKRLEASRDQLARIVEGAQEGIVSVDLEGVITSWNAGAERIYGYTAAEAVGRTIDLITTPENRRQGFEFIERLRRGESVGHVEAERVTKAGGRISVDLSLSPIFDSTSTLSGVSAFFHDITDRKRLEREAQEAASYARTLIEASLDPLVTINPKGKITDVNEATVKAIGVAREKLIGSDFADYFVETDQAREGYLEAFRTGQVRDYPLTLRSVDGRLIDVLYNATVYRDTTGAVTGVFAAARDITERKRAERARDQLASIIESAEDAIIGKDLDGVITYWNTGAVKLYGYTAAEVIGRSIDILAPPDKKREAAELTAKLRRGEPVSAYETERITKSGEHIDVSLTLSPVRDHAGELIGVSTVVRDVRQRKRAEEQARSAALYVRSLIEASLDPLITISAEGRITDVNEATVKATGVAREQLIGSDFSAYFTDPQQARNGYLEMFDKGSVKDFPLSLRHASGSVMEVLYNATLYRDPEGKVAGVFAAARDVTERRRAEETVRLQAQQLQTMLATTPDGFGRFDSEGLNLLEVNDAYCRMSGYSREELLAMKVTQLTPDPPELTSSKISEVRAMGFGRYVAKHRRKDGTLYDVEVGASYWPETRSVMVFVRDITEQKRAEETIRESEARLRLQFTRMPIGYVTWDADFRVASWNPAAEKIFGFSAQEAQGKHPYDFLVPRSAQPAVDDIWSRLMAGDETARSINENLTKDGRTILCDWTNTPLKDADGKVTGVLAMVQDITERKRTEEALAASERDFRSLAESMPQIVWVTRADGWNIYFNQQWMDYTGLTLDESYGHGWNKPFHPDDQKRAWDAWQNAVNNRAEYSLECRIRKFDGSYHWWLVRAVPYFDISGKIDKWFGTCTDIDKIKQAEQELQRHREHLEELVADRTAEVDAANEKLERANKELEAFAYSVSHDLRAPLRAVDGFSNMLVEDYGDKLDDEGKRLIGVVRESAVKMTQMIEDILGFSRVGRAELAPAPVDMEALVREAIKVVEPLTQGRKISFQVGELPQANGDGPMLQRVWTNLIDNAVKYTGPKPEARIEIGSTPGAGETVYFVRDNGVGFDLQYADKLFGVFQRLHGAEFPGTGIGLAIVKRVIDRHGGRTWAEGKLNEGAAFYFALPNAAADHD